MKPELMLFAIHRLLHSASIKEGAFLISPECPKVISIGFPLAAKSLAFTEMNSERSKVVHGWNDYQMGEGKGWRVLNIIARKGRRGLQFSDAFSRIDIAKSSAMAPTLISNIFNATKWLDVVNRI